MRNTPTLNDDYLNGRDVEKHIDYLLIGHDFLDGKDADDLKKWINGEISFGEGDDLPMTAATCAINNEDDIDTLGAMADHLGSWEVLHNELGLDDIDTEGGEDMYGPHMDEIRAAICKLIASDAEAREFCDEFEIDYAIWFDAQDSDADEYEELAQWLDLKEQAENYCGGRFRDCTLISEGKWIDYCRDLAYDIGEVERNSLVDNFIDWEKYADSIEQDHSEISVDGNTFYVRN